MTDKERFINTVLGKKVDRLPRVFLFGPWPDTVARWKNEGLPKDKEWDYDLHMDKGVYYIQANYGFYPKFEQVLLEDKGDTSIIMSWLGVKQEVSNKIATIPRDIEHPVTDFESWEKLKKERLDSREPLRFEKGMKEYLQKMSKEGYLMQVGSYPWGLFGTLRELLGVEEFLISFYTQPELIKDMMNYFTDFWIDIYEQIQEMVQIDIVHIWEDMSGKTGSLLSPDMVNEFMIPNYKKIKAFCLKHNIPVFSVDTDGDAEQLMPLFIDAGVNLIYPCEVRAGSDVVRYRNKYPMLALSGGIDKMRVAESFEKIDYEIDRIKCILKTTGYIPSLDHQIPPEISYQNFKYFIKKLWQEMN